METLKRVMAIALCCSIPFGAAYGQAQTRDLEMKLASMSDARPRLFLGRDGFETLKRNASGPVGKALAERVAYDAGLLLDQPPVERLFDLSGHRILGSSRAVLYRVDTLATAYALTGDARFAERAAKEMLSASAYKDWNPSHFLDTAEMTLALSIGYDWLYSQLDPERRKIISTAILEKGLKPSASGKEQGWVTGTNNWTAVCHAGMIAGALAIREEDPALSDTLIKRAVSKLPRYLQASYGSNGAYPEGPTYWDYGTEFAVLALAMLDSAFGEDFGLLDGSPGFKKTGSYIIQAFGPSGLPFSYSDCGIPSNPKKGQRCFPAGTANVWLSVRCGRPDWYRACERDAILQVASRRPKFPDSAAKEPERGVLYSRTLPLALAYLPADDGSSVLSSASGDLSYFSGNDGLTSLSVHRSGWGPDDVYLGVKGGSPSASHGHMDGGSFVLEAGGVRWAEDLGMVNYSKLESLGVKIWDGSQNGQRWEVFRYGPLSHNILLVDVQLQNVKGMALTSEFCGEPGRQLSTLDLTPLYEGQAKGVSRSFRLLPGGKVSVSDKVKGLKAGSSLRWQLCTRAKAEAVDAGKMRLLKDGRSLLVEALKPSSGRWSVVECASLLKSYDMPDDKNASMLHFDVPVPAGGDVEIQIVLRLEGTDPASK